MIAEITVLERLSNRVLAAYSALERNTGMAMPPRPIAWAAHQIVGGGGKREDPTDARHPAMTGLAQSSRRLGPSEDLLNAFAPAAADRVTGMAGGAAVDRRAPVAGVLGDMRRGVALAQCCDEAGSIVGLVGADRDAAVARPRLGHGQRRLALGRAGGRGQPRIDHQTIAILHHHVPYIGQLCRLTQPLAIEPRIRIAGRGVRLIAALLAVKIALAIATRRRRFAATVLRAEALHAGPGFDQRAVNREMLARQELLDPW